MGGLFNPARALVGGSCGAMGHCPCGSTPGGSKVWFTSISSGSSQFIPIHRCFLLMGPLGGAPSFGLVDQPDDVIGPTCDDLPMVDWDGDFCGVPASRLDHFPTGH